MAKTFFISDAHIGTTHSRQEILKEKYLLSFFDYVAEYGERLFIVGDLFDFWFEYRTVIPKGYSKILCALSQLSELNKEVHYIAGNHDFWMRDFLETELKIHLHYDSLEKTINNKRFYIAHGDGLNESDYGYRFLKRIFRNRLNIFLYSLLHPDIGIPLAKWVSNLSRGHTSGNAQPNHEDYIKKAQQKFSEGFDYAIFGHLHSPRNEAFGQKIYINLGDWIKSFTYAEFDGENIQLLKWA